MGNFYTDNEDLKFHMEKRVDWKRIIELKEDLASEECPYDTVEEAVESYLDMLRDPIGELAANRIAPRAAEIDEQGCTFEEGSVELPPAMVQNLKDLTDADLMGLTLPRKYGGLEFPTTFYTAATEIISSADASLMNLFGLQGIAETIALFASEDIKAQYVPDFAAGRTTGAMVLTEPDCGSDLLSIQTSATLDERSGMWTLRGTKRFITNGCGDVLLVLARSEDPLKYSGGRGLSLFLVEKGKGVKVRRIEHKLGIHGSPTCELYFDNAAGKLIGDRGKGLTKYVNWLMNAARLGVAAQALGICEAAFLEARSYADQREQFGKKIKEFPPVADMIVWMKVLLEAVRSLTYSTSQIVDIEQGIEARLESIERGDQRFKELKKEKSYYGNLADLLTPISKYYASEASIFITNVALQIHGGNGYMKEYPIERLYRDARITNIYEGTSQIQIDRAMTKIIKGVLSDHLRKRSHRPIKGKGMRGLASKVEEARSLFDDALEVIRNRKVFNPKTSRDEKDIDYRNLMARRVVDMGTEVYISYLMLEEAEISERKKAVAERFIEEMLLKVQMNGKAIEQGDKSTLEKFNTIVYGTS